MLTGLGLVFPVFQVFSGVDVGVGHAGRARNCLIFVYILTIELLAFTKNQTNWPAAGHCAAVPTRLFDPALATAGQHSARQFVGVRAKARFAKTTADYLMNELNALGFTWHAHNLAFPPPAREPKKPPFMLRKLMAQYVHDLTHLEGNPFTFVEVQTLLEGTTIGGHRVFDQMQVLNQHKGLCFLLETLGNPAWQLGRELACALHARIACEEALCWGEFRSGQVGISGTAYQPPLAADLPRLYADGLASIGSISHPFERALAYFFWGAQKQFFYDGNKRTARAVMNYILMSHGYFYLSVPAAQREGFDQMMVDFYNEKDATAGMQWLLGCYKDWD